MACPCYNGGPTCILSANVCEGYFVIISPPISALNITEQGNYGTATLYENYVVYEHDGNSLVTDTFRYLNSDNEVCEVTVTIEDTIPVETEVKIFTAYGDCEVGTATYKWTLPEGVTLVDGYTIYDQTIHVIVPLFDIDNPTIQFDFIVDVCCDYCNNCCKCDTITYLPPICTTECGEDEECYCPYDCTEYNPETGNCEPTCTSDEVCCTLVTTGSTEIAYSIDYEWDCFSIYDRGNLEYFEVSVTATTNGSNLTFYLPDIDNLSPPTAGCMSLTEQEQLDISSGSYIINENRGYFIEDNVIKLIVTNCSGDCLNSIFWLYAGMTAETPCGLIENNVLLSPLFYEGGAPVDWYASSACQYFAEYTDTDPVALCNVSALCTVSSNTETNYCAECCDDGDCIPNPGCFNDTLFCQYGECFCVVGNELIPQPTDGSCCPQCTDDTTLPPCYICENGLIIAPNINCPPNWVWDYDTCECTADDCLTYQCIVPIGDVYCPEIPDCGCADENICLPCDSINCITSEDCPYGCACDEVTLKCVDNPCYANDCDNIDSPLYCPNIPLCGCDGRICIPCDTVTCVTNDDCPFGCICDGNTNLCKENPCDTYTCDDVDAIDYCPNILNCGCDDNTDNCIPCDSVPCVTTDDCPLGCECLSGVCQDPCNILQIACDAYLVHNENDLTLNYVAPSNFGGNYYEVHGFLGLEPAFDFSTGNPIWSINLDNYIGAGGWTVVTGAIYIDGELAVNVINGNIRFYPNSVGKYIPKYVLIKLEVAGRLVWYRLEFVSVDFDYENPNFEGGSGDLCREIFTVESLTGIDWLVNNWMVDNEDVVVYSSEDVLVIDCPGAAEGEGIIVGITAEVFNLDNDCEISTCGYEFECECFGTKNCEEFFIDIHQTFDVGTNIWDMVADVYYDNGSFNEIVLTDCQLLHSLQSPTPYDCSRCGGVPYLSPNYMTGTGDNVAVDYPEGILVCYNVTANDEGIGNCENCVCGYTFTGAELVSYNGSSITVLVTDVLNAQICYQTNVAGSTVSGDPCCIQHCEPLVFPTACTLTIEAIPECYTFGSYIVSVIPNGNLGNITNVFIDDISVDFVFADNTATIGSIELAPNNSFEVLAVDSYGCSATTSFDTDCCSLQYSLLPIECSGNTLDINCQSCEDGNTQIIGYEFNINNNGIPYDITFTTNYGVFDYPNITYSNFNINVNQAFFNGCNDMIITEMYVNVSGCEYIVTSICLGEECYVGFWESIGFNLFQWNNPSSQSFVDYDFTGLTVNGINYDFTILPMGSINLKSIICQSATQLGLGICTDETWSNVCSSAINTATDCYNDPFGCAISILQLQASPVASSLHKKIQDNLLLAWNCRLNSYLGAINTQLSLLGYPSLTLIKYTQTPLLIAPTLLPNGSTIDQMLVYKYTIISDEKYPQGMIQIVRDTVVLPSKPVIEFNCTDEEMTCHLGYNCEECNLLVLQGTYPTTEECVLTCASSCVSSVTAIPNQVWFDQIITDPELNPSGLAIFGDLTDIYGILYNNEPIEACTITGDIEDQLITQLGTLSLMFDFPPLPDCASYTKATITVIGEPIGNGWINALNVGNGYAPLYYDNAYNSYPTYYSSVVSGYIPVEVDAGLQLQYYGNSYDSYYPATSSPVSGILITTFDVALAGVTANPSTWSLELIVFSGNGVTGECDILHSAEILLYINCDPCGDICVFEPIITIDCEYDEGEETGLHIINFNGDSGPSTYSISYYNHLNELVEIVGIGQGDIQILPVDNGLISGYEYTFTILNENTGCIWVEPITTNCCLPTLLVQPYECDLITGGGADLPMMIGIKLNETFSGIGYDWLVEVESLNNTFPTFNVVITSQFVIINELGVFDIFGIGTGFECESPNSPLVAPYAYNHTFINNWITSDVQLTFTASGTNCSQVINYNDFCDSGLYSFTIASSVVTCDLDNDIISIDFVFDDDYYFNNEYTISVTGCGTTSVENTLTALYTYNCLIYDNEEISFLITNNVGCQQTYVLPPQNITVTGISWTCDINEVSFEILSPTANLEYSCADCLNLLVGGTNITENPQTFFCQLDELSPPSSVTITITNENGCEYDFTIDISDCADDCSNNPDLVIECQECTQSVFMSQDFMLNTNDDEGTSFLGIINIDDTLYLPTGAPVVLVSGYPNYDDFEYFATYLLNETGVQLYIKYTENSGGIVRGNLYAVTPCCNNDMNIEIFLTSVTLGGDTLITGTTGFLIDQYATCDYIKANIFDDHPCCICYTATPTGSVYNVSSDTIYYGYDPAELDLNLWNIYTTGECINVDIDGNLYFTREVTYTNSCRPAILRNSLYDNNSQVTCNVLRSSFIADIINDTIYTIPNGTQFNLSWSGLGRATNYVGILNGNINNPLGTIFTVNTDILQGMNFKFGVAHNSITCPGQEVTLTITSNDIVMDPLIITLTT